MGWKVPDFTKFSGDTNESTVEHVARYQSKADNLANNENLKTKYFPNDLTKNVFMWLNTLPPQFIFNWNQLERAFHEQFYISQSNISLKKLANVRKKVVDSIDDDLNRFRIMKPMCFTQVPEHDLVELAVGGIGYFIRKKLNTRDLVQTALKGRRLKFAYKQKARLEEEVDPKVEGDIFVDPVDVLMDDMTQKSARNSEKGTKNVIARKSSQPTTASSFFFTVFYTLFYAALDIKVDSFVVVLTFLCWVSSSFIVNSISFELAWKTVYKNGGAPPVFQSPKCPRWRLFDYDSSPRTATRCQSSMLQGRRKSQEDRTLCVLDVRIPFPGTMGIREVVVGIVAVFDGHNGAEASEMASKLLMEYFVLHTYFLLDAMYSVVSKTSTGKLLHRRDHDHGNLLHRWKEILGWQWHELHSERLQNVFSANFDDSFHLEILKEALLRAIHDIDVRFSEEASRNNIHSGSTATVVLVADDKFLVANIGDSKAFLCSENFQSPKEAKASLLELYRQTERDGSVSVWDREKYRLASSRGLNHFAVKELTRDHHPDREDERTRVEAAGGQVLNWGGLPRVNGQLAITRAIGDVLFKSYGVISAPKVTDWHWSDPHCS
ncbi:probable protein phosphatase 2C 51 [Lathyrus oleraceus]|nr:probable protein phosphatase 2C 51 [Pisum sativum]